MRNVTVETLTRLVGGRLVHGCPEHLVSDVADVRFANASQVAFVQDEKFLRFVKQSKAGVLLVRERLDSDAIQIVVTDPHRAFALVAMHFHPVQHATTHSVHSAASVDTTAELMAPVVVGSHAVVGAGTKIGSGTRVLAGVVIGENVTIGRDCVIFPRAVLYDGVVMGDRCIIHAGAVLGSDGFGYVTLTGGERRKFPQLGGLILGDDVEIGANSTLDRGALTANLIGKGVKIDNLCHVGHNCQIGEHTSISALSAFSADTHVGARCTLAGNVRSGGGVKICDDVVLGGGAIIVKDVNEPGVYSGHPLQSRRSAARTRVLIGRLSDMAKELRELKKKVKGLVAGSTNDRATTDR